MIGLGAATVVLLVAAVAGWLRAPEATVTRHEITLPPISDLAGVSGVLQRGVALAPDGSSIVFANVDPGGRLMVKPRDALEATPLAGTEGGLSPFFSPDGAWIGFLSEGRVRKVPRGGGGVITLSDVAGTGTGASGARWGWWPVP